jgi:signal transduction histidine kinase/CheY-like chemotaxis protein
LSDNEQTLHLLYVNSLHREEHLLLKLKSNNEKELLVMKGEELRYLIGNVAHDLKSPLHGFTLELDLLRHRFELSQDSLSLESIASLRRISSFLLMTINRAIDFSKVSSGMLLVPSLETIDINDTMSWVVKCVSPLNELPIKVEPLPDSMCANLITDRHWFMENLLCLVSNAQKFTGDGGITVRCGLESGPKAEEEDGGTGGGSIVNWLTPSPIPSRHLSTTSDSVTTRESFLPLGSSSQSLSTLALSLNLLVRIEVEDSGIGTRPDERPGLFLPFKQAQRRVGGTGLGLYSLAKRVEALGGSCGVTDRRDGGPGSLFWFNFPYRPDESVGLVTVSTRLSQDLPGDEFSKEAQGDPTRDSFIKFPTSTNSSPRNVTVGVPLDLKGVDLNSKPSALGPTINHYRILLVEDSVLIQKTTSRALKNEGYVVDIARNGLECLKMVKEHEYDFILMDIQMPVMDGIEATKRLREIEAMEELSRHPPPANGMIQDGGSGEGIETKGSEDWGIRMTALGSPGPNELISDSLLDSMENGRVPKLDLSPPKLLFPLKRAQVIIGLSANSDSVTMEEALQAGMNEFLSKPLAVSRLKKCFEQISQNSPR